MELVRDSTSTFGCTNTLNIISQTDAVIIFTNSFFFQNGITKISIIYRELRSLEILMFVSKMMPNDAVSIPSLAELIVLVHNQKE